MTYALKLTTNGERIGINYDADKSYETISQAVGGYIELVRLYNDIDMWVNEEGKLDRLPFNPEATIIYMNTFGMGLSDVIVGDVLFTSHDEEGNTTSLEAHQLAYLETFLGTLENV